ncbi:two-component system regulatory protein YycI [Paenibacillus sp. 2TAB19]|uniref:two-component system regulatory protein YycI n=1 Tax=Paenibacillus sp. 2TAB19 TaxID=3233003 RepID=UPI003F9A36B8
MDWSRAKSVLIFSFLLLNILLGYQLWLDIREQVNVNVNSAELPQDKVLLMQQKGISLSANLPLETPELRDITYLLHSDSRKNAQPIMLETAVDGRIVFTQSELVKTLGSIIPELNQYVYDQLVSDDGVFVLHRITEGRPMFDVKLELHHSFQKITGYQQDRIEILSRGDAKQVLPAAKVVASLIETYLPNGAVITDIQLGYHGQIFDSEKQVSAPSWRVMLEDGQIYYVHAISGEVTTDEEQVETVGLR